MLLISDTRLCCILESCFLFNAAGAGIWNADLMHNVSKATSARCSNATMHLVMSIRRCSMSTSEATICYPCLRHCRIYSHVIFRMTHIL